MGRGEEQSRGERTSGKSFTFRFTRHKIKFTKQNLGGKLGRSRKEGERRNRRDRAETVLSEWPKQQAEISNESGTQEGEANLWFIGS